MAVIATTYYSVSATYGAHTWNSGESTSPVFACPYTAAAAQLGVTVGYILFGTTRFYPAFGWIKAGATGPLTVSAGTNLGSLSQSADLKQYRVTSPYFSVVTANAPRIAYSGNRFLSVACSLGGLVASPSVGENTSIVHITRPSADTTAATNVMTITAGDGTPSTGTLTSRGYAAGVWVNWTWPSAVLTSASQTAPGVATEKTITLSLLAGADDATITANFTRASNSASTWSPYAQNVVVHLLNGSLVETESSINSVGSSTAWTTFRNKGFTAFKCEAGGKMVDWYPTLSGYKTGAYMMNVSGSARFTVAPISGQRVYAWKLQLVDGTYVDFGSANAADISGFAEGCKIHLYLTSASPNPRLIYDGFDTAGTVPANQNVIVGGVSWPVGSVWTSPNNDPVSVALSPAAWATRALGQARSVLVDAVETPLANIAGTGASVLSSAAQYSLTHVKFKQAAVATDGVLTVTVVRDTVSALDGIVVQVAQEETPLGSVTATGAATGSTSGTVGYYSGANGPLRVSVAIDYGDQSPSDFVIRAVIPVAELLDGDTTDADGTTLTATPTTRALTIYVTQKVDVGNLDAVVINLTRTVGAGDLEATSAGPVTQCRAGALSVTMPADTSVQVPITVECSANPGYLVKTLLVQDATGTRTYYSGRAMLGVSSIYLAIPQANDGDDIKVILVMEAIIVGSPSIQPLLPDDLGKFSASVASDGGHGDFRVGDSVTLTAAVVQVSSSPLTGAAIGSPVFNDVTITPVRDGTDIEATVTLGPDSNVFKIPVYAVLETASAPAEAGTITLTPTWDVEDTLVISGTTYRRIGSQFTVTAPLTSTSPSTYTLISGKVSRRAIAAGFAYVEVEMLLPVVASTTTRTFTTRLRGPTKLEAVYAIGTQYPSLVVAAYDYDSDSYITQGIRPTVRTTPVSPATLSDNLIADLATDWPVSGTPGDTYKGAAFLYRTVTTTALLPGIDIRITSTVGARLEVWNATTSLWVPYSPSNITLADEFTFFRVAVGDAPENLVSLTFEVAVTVDEAETETDVPGCGIYASSGTVYDGNFVLSADKVVQARSRSVLHARATPPPGYIVTGWYVDGVLTLSGAALSIVVPDTGLTLKPRLALRQLVALSVMVLNADPNRTDEGVWVSKLFRAQQPWKPLTATVVAKPAQSPVILGVLKDGADAPEELDTENPGTVAVTVTGDGMRRLPPGQIQKTRFVRYMLVLSGDVSVASVAIGSGAETMKGGH